MTYTVELDMHALMLIRRLLGQRPYDEVAPVIASITEQMAVQESAAGTAQEDHRDRQPIAS